MIKFSEQNQSFYDMDLNYADPPSDLIEITADQHSELLGKINSGCVVFFDLTFSKPSPSQYHTWNGKKWIDNRTAEEKKADYIKSLQPLTRRQFRLALVQNGFKLKEIQALIEKTENEVILIEWEDATTFHRDSESIQTMADLLKLDSESVNDLWSKALLL